MRKHEKINYDETSAPCELDIPSEEQQEVTERSVLVPVDVSTLPDVNDYPSKWFENMTKDLEARMVSLFKEILAPEVSKIEERLMSHLDERLRKQKEEIEERLMSHLDERFRKQKEEIKSELVDVTKHLVEEQAKRITDIETQCNNHLKEQGEQILSLTQEVTALKNIVGTHEKKEASYKSITVYLKHHLSVPFLFKAASYKRVTCVPKDVLLP